MAGSSLQWSPTIPGFTVCELTHAAEKLSLLAGSVVKNTFRKYFDVQNTQYTIVFYILNTKYTLVTWHSLFHDAIM